MIVNEVRAVACEVLVPFVSDDEANVLDTNHPHIQLVDDTNLTVSIRELVALFRKCDLCTCLPARFDLELEYLQPNTISEHQIDEHRMVRSTTVSTQ